MDTQFDLIGRALARLDGAETPPSLDDLAGELGASPAHLQRVFTAWVGVSPKRYAQHLAVDRARELLRDRRAVLDVALDVGLSGPSRLHDLFVRWEAMTPGAYAQRGAGLDIAWGAFPSPFGPVVAMGTAHGLCALGFAARDGVEATRAELATRWPAARLRQDEAALAPWVEAAFGGGRAPIHAFGAPFQIKVWEALLAIPDGHVASYGDIARQIGAPKASRAVGTAIGANDLAWLIPCHRVLRESGGWGGYRWGLPVKRAMLAVEASREETARAA